MTLDEFEIQAANERDAAIKDRDEAYAELARQSDEARKARSLLNEARAEVERLVALLRKYEGKMDPDDVLRSVAERQREACALVALQWISAPAGGVLLQDAVRATPLVTEETP